MNKMIIGVMATAMLTTTAAFAQNEKTDTKKEEKKEIIIERKEGGKNEKMVIEIDGKNVTINGKPADQYQGDKHIVIDEDIVINGNTVRVPGQNRTFFHYIESNRAMLGVVTEKADKGAKVKEIKKGSAAEKAGLKAGDIITGVNGTTITTQEDLVKTIGKYKPNDVADITYSRNGKQSKVKATLDKSEENAYFTPRNFSIDSDQSGFRVGPPMAMTTPRGPHAFAFNDSDMWEFRIDRPKYGMSIEDNADGDGVKITGVETESNAMKAGLQKDDIITEIEGKTVKGVRDVREVLADTGDKSTLSLKVLRNGSPVDITVRVPKVIRKVDL